MTNPVSYGAEVNGIKVSKFGKSRS